MAIALPILFLFVCGIAAFGGAFNLKQKLSNAAREGARFGASQSPLDLFAGGTPPSIQALRDVVQNYMTNAGLTCPIDTGPTTANNLQWMYTSSGCANFSVTIDRNYSVQVSPGGFLVPPAFATATHVTISYPYTWLMPTIFGQTITASFPSSIVADSYMQNTP
jgi:Flp pilus assembly protein TadG